MEYRGGRSGLEQLAAGVALLIGLGQTAISAYWALGGLWAIGTVGGAIEDLARSGDTRASWLAWGATAVKACGVALALLLALQSRRSVLRLPLLAAGWGAAAVLTGYGGLLTAVGALAFLGVIDIPPDANRYALGWHLAFWDPMFLLWGLALGILVLSYRRRTAGRSVSRPAGSLPGTRPRRS